VIKIFKSKSSDSFIVSNKKVIDGNSLAVIICLFFLDRMKKGIEVRDQTRARLIKKSSAYHTLKRYRARFKI